MTIDEIKKVAESTPNTVASVASSIENAKKYGLPLNLQFFTTDEDGGGSGTSDQDDKTDDKKDDPTDNPDRQEEGQKDEKTFTQSQVDQMIKDRIARAEKDKQKAIAEAEKLAKMNADEKRQYEFEKLQRENEELKAAQNKYSLGKEASKMLAESGITATDEILDFVVREDAEKTSEAVKAFSELIDRVSDERMKEKLRGKPPWIRLVKEKIFRFPKL